MTRGTAIADSKQRTTSTAMAGDLEAVSSDLTPLPSGGVIPEQLRAFCGLAIRPDQAELVTVGTGMPRVACVVAAPDPEPP